jgi:hypothetical protein
MSRLNWLLGSVGALTTTFVLTFLIIPAVATGKSIAACKVAFISSVSPGNGPPGTLVTIKGQNFKGTINHVEFGTNDANNIAIKATTIQVRVPSIAPGRYTINMDDNCGADPAVTYSRQFLVEG